MKAAVLACLECSIFMKCFLLMKKHFYDRTFPTSFCSKNSKLKIQVLIFCAGHWEIKVLLLDWTCLVCTCWNLIKKKTWKVTTDIGTQVKQVEPKLIYLTVFSLQRVFSWEETHRHGFVQFSTLSLKVSWEHAGFTTPDGKIFLASLQPVY